MAGLGFKDFQVGEVLTSSDVDGYLMQQTVMRFADSGARGSALGTASGTGVALAEGMVSYLDTANSVQVYTGAAWVGLGPFTASTAITTTNASWPVPTLEYPVVRVTVIGGGGGGGGSIEGTGAAGNSSTFACAAGTATAAGGSGGNRASASFTGQAGSNGFVSANEGRGGIYQGGAGDSRTGEDGGGGAITVAYLDMTGISTASVTIGAGGAGGATITGTSGGAGGNGVVIFEYRAG